MSSRTIHSDRRENRTKFLKQRLLEIVTADSEIINIQLANRLGVGTSTVTRWLRELKEEGKL